MNAPKLELLESRSGHPDLVGRRHADVFVAVEPQTGDEPTIPEYAFFNPIVFQRLAGPHRIDDEALSDEQEWPPPCQTISPNARRSG